MPFPVHIKYNKYIQLCTVTNVFPVYFYYYIITHNIIVSIYVIYSRDNAKHFRTHLYTQTINYQIHIVSFLEIFIY